MQPLHCYIYSYNFRDFELLSSTAWCRVNAECYLPMCLQLLLHKNRPISAVLNLLEVQHNREKTGSKSLLLI